jgi:hypothetical protein
VRQTRGLTQKKVNGKTLDAFDRPKSNEISTDISYYGLLRRLIRTSRAVIMVSFTEPHGTLF